MVGPESMKPATRPRAHSRSEETRNFQNAISIIGLVASLVGVVLTFFGITNDSIARFPFANREWSVLALSFIAAMGLICVSFYLRKKGMPGWSNACQISGTVMATLLVAYLVDSWNDPTGRNRPSELESASGVPSPNTVETPEFLSIWSPSLGEYLVQSKGMTETVRGVELEARSCPRDNAIFNLTEIPVGARVGYDVQAFSTGEFDGVYEISIVGGGVDESLVLDHGGSERISVQVLSEEQVQLTLQSLHDVSGRDCRDTREVIAFKRGIVE